ncbi:ACP S-malonyltransferase [Sphingomonas bacterium]|uniref:ACP S-malonyltransferase n=1 Tax=Sphingomonas bacterium TaxID=1895847 RepID=UPI001575E0EB|nr:acyltransferase domain-containing protein [Sphingomonas bacterium]
MTLALLCSGQGRQDRGMFDVFEGQPAAVPILAEVGALLGRDVGTLLRDASEAELHANRTSQILCVARALVTAAGLAPPKPYIVAGYSVGEMAAWGVAGVWTSEQTLRLTAARAETMDAASGANDGLGFVRGLTRDRVDVLVARFECAIAIVNPALLFVIGGEREQVARCCAAALDEGAVAARPIAVNIASHTPRLSGAVAPFRAALDASMPGRPHPGVTLISAADASIVSGARGVPGLAAQLDTTIDWAATLEALVERGVRRVLELGPGTAIADMARGAYPVLDARSIDEFRALDGVTGWIERQAR